CDWRVAFILFVVHWKRPIPPRCVLGHKFQFPRPSGRNISIIWFVPCILRMLDRAWANHTYELKQLCVSIVLYGSVAARVRLAGGWSIRTGQLLRQSFRGQAGCSGASCFSCCLLNQSLRVSACVYHAAYVSGASHWCGACGAWRRGFSFHHPRSASCRSCGRRLGRWVLCGRTISIRQIQSNLRHHDKTTVIGAGTLHLCCT